jgi:hypothetical protein
MSLPKANLKTACLVLRPKFESNRITEMSKISTAASPRSGISAGGLLNLVFLVLAIALVAALVVQMASAWTELRIAGRTGELAKTDAILFSTIQGLRANRGAAQTALQMDDNPKA